MAKVFIGIPCHKNDISASTQVSVQLAASQKHKVQSQILSLSLLAKNFNSLFCSAWDRGCHYFVLLHSDLGVAHHAGSWVDKLIQLCEDNKAAAISAVVPIKSDAGHTSTALVLDKGNPYNMRRVTVRELQKLPREIITREDLALLFSQDRGTNWGPLLINTGCLIMDLKNFDWAGERWPGFAIHDELVWSKDGRPSSYTIPEDWFLSLWLDEVGWPYFATNCLSVNHVGVDVFTNNGEWGKERDTVLGQPSPEEWRSTNRK